MLGAGHSVFGLANRISSCGYSLQLLGSLRFLTCALDKCNNQTNSRVHTFVPSHLSKHNSLPSRCLHGCSPSHTAIKARFLQQPSVIDVSASSNHTVCSLDRHQAPKPHTILTTSCQKWNSALLQVRNCCVAAGDGGASCASKRAAKQSCNQTRALVLDGRKVAADWTHQLAADVQETATQLGRPPHLAVVLVGSRPDSRLYVTRKQEAGHKAGILVSIHHLPDNILQHQLEAAVHSISASSDVDGILIQLPLPKQLNEESVMEQLDPQKDVDGFHPLNMGRMLMKGRTSRLVPATPLGCMELLRRYNINVEGKNCVVVGDSNIVGTPLASLMRDHNAASVTICHRICYKEWFEDPKQVQASRVAAASCLPRLPGPGVNRTIDALLEERDVPLSHQLPEIARSADILVVAVGSVTHTCIPPELSVMRVQSITTHLRTTKHGAGLCYLSVPSAKYCLLSSGCSNYLKGSNTTRVHMFTGVTSVAGRHPELVRKDWVKPGAVVLDVGINVITSPQSTTPSPQDASETMPRQNWQDEASGKCTAYDKSNVSFAMDSAYSPGTYHVVGDVAFEEVSQVASAITPVPGGIGPMTIAAVLHNTIRASRHLAGLEQW